MRFCVSCSESEPNVKFSGTHRKCNRCRNAGNREQRAEYGRSRRANQTDTEREFHRLRVRKYREELPHLTFHSTSRYQANKIGAYSDLSKEDAYDIYYTADVCAYCGKERGPKDGPRSFHIDHVIPMRQGGPNSRWNLVKACINCNTSKGFASLFDFRTRTSEFTDERYASVIGNMARLSGRDTTEVYALLTQSHEFQSIFKREKAKMEEALRLTHADLAARYAF